MPVRSGMRRPRLRRMSGFFFFYKKCVFFFEKKKTNLKKRKIKLQYNVIFLLIKLFRNVPVIPESDRF